MNEMMASIEINIYWSNLSPVYCSIASPSHNVNHYKFDRPRYLAAYKITLDPAHSLKFYGLFMPLNGIQSLRLCAV